MGYGRVGRTNTSKETESRTEEEDQVPVKQQTRTYLVKVWRVDATGKKQRLGAAEIYTTSKTKAREEAFQELWDPDYPESQYFPEMEVTDITDQNRNGK